MNEKHPPTDLEMTRRARELRREMTVPERWLWYALRDRRLAGFKFRRQVVIGRCIVDFYHHASGLVIEIDGDSHAERGERDRERQAWLESRNLRVLRFSNDEILHDMENVLEAVVSVLTRRPAFDHLEDQPRRGG